MPSSSGECRKSPLLTLRPVVVEKLPSDEGVRYLYHPGEMEGERRRATDPVWSLEAYRIGRSIIKPNEPILYYLDTACVGTTGVPSHGFVREEHLVVPFDTQLPQTKVVVVP